MSAKKDYHEMPKILGNSPVNSWKHCVSRYFARALIVSGQGKPL